MDINRSDIKKHISMHNDESRNKIRKNYTKEYQIDNTITSDSLKKERALEKNALFAQNDMNLISNCNGNICPVEYNRIYKEKNVSYSLNSIENIHNNCIQNEINTSDDSKTYCKSFPYHDYINQTYKVLSKQKNLIQEQKNESDQILPEKQLKLNNDVKQLKSIFKSTSTQNFYSSSRLDNRSQDRLSLQYSYDNNRSSLKENENLLEKERPVLHVQFVPNKSGAANCSHTIVGKLDGKSPIDSIITDPSSSSSESSSSDGDDSSSICQFAEARPPDGGWGWVVVFASFMVNMIADGVTFSFGVIFVEFINYFGQAKAKTAWIGSLFMGIPLLSGPIASFLTDRYGCRKMTIVGSILSCLGFMLSSMANSIEMLFFTFGILAGFGLSLCYVSAVVIVAYYFEKKRSFATGLSVCGSGIGTFVFAPLIQVLLEEYGWRGTTLILAGIFLNMVIFGLLMRDLEWTTHRAKLKAKKYKDKIRISAESFSPSNSTNTCGTASNLHQNSNGTDDFSQKSKQSEDLRISSSLVMLPTFLRDGEKVPLEVLELLVTHRNFHHLMLQNYSTISPSRSFSGPLSLNNKVLTGEQSYPLNLEDWPANREINKRKISSGEDRFQNRKTYLLWLKRNNENQRRSNRLLPTAYLKDLRLHRHSLTYRGAMLNINRYRLRASSCPDIYRNSMTTIAKEKEYLCQGIKEFKNIILDMCDFSHFSNIQFFLFAFSNLLLYTWYDVPYVYLADNAIELGVSETDASLLIGIIGFLNMLGEIILGWAGDLKNINVSVVYAASMALCGAVTMLIPITKTYMLMCSIAGLFGLFIAANYALTSIILVEIITIERFTNAYGLLLLVQGIANLIGPPLAGWIYDVTGNYDLSFYLAGFFIAISGLILVIMPVHGRYKKYRALSRQSHTESDASPTTPIGRNLPETRNEICSTGKELSKNDFKKMATVDAV